MIESSCASAGRFTSAIVIVVAAAVASPAFHTVVHCPTTRSNAVPTGVVYPEPPAKAAVK